MSEEELAQLRENIDQLAALTDYPTVPMNRDSVVREVRALLDEVERLRVDVEMARQQRDAWQRLARQGVTWTGASGGD